MSNVPVNRLELQVGGMHCGGCVASVERALRSVPGVSRAQVNLATEQALVETDAPLDDERTAALIDAVSDAGFSAKPRRDRHAALQERRAQRTAADRDARRRIAIGLALGLPALALHLLGDAALPWHISTAVQGLLATAVLVLTGSPMLREAIRAAQHRGANMDTLVALGSGTALLLGWTALITAQHEWQLFHASVMIVLFVAIGRYLETRARHHAAAALEDLGEHIPQQARRITNDGEETVPIDWIAPDDLLRIGPQSLVPVDGELRDGTVAVDEALLTGEPVPRQRAAGDRLYAGTTVIEGSGVLVATARGADSTAAKIVDLVEQAQSTRPPWQRFADRAAAIFVPCVLAGTALTLIGWLLAGSPLNWAVGRALAVLVVACPCALGLAVPTAILVGTTRAADQGILFRSAEALEALSGVRHVIWDKTGTLTRGRPEVVETATHGDIARDELLRLAATVEQGSPHPLGQAIVAAAGSTGSSADEPEVAAGSGVSGMVDGRRVRVGSGRWLASLGVSLPDTEMPAQSRAWVVVDDHVAGWIAFADPLHPDARAALTRLREMNVSASLLSGDNRRVVERVAGELDLAEWDGEQSPDDKLTCIERRRAAGPVAMVGDGINDAPALAAASVGIALASGADLATAAADVCVTSGTPDAVPEAIAVARATSRIIRQNLAWAVGYNVAMLPLAIFTGLPPGLAAAAMMLSSFSVVGNSLRLRRA